MTPDEVRLYMYELRDINREIDEIFELQSIVRSKAERTTPSYSQVFTSHSGHYDKVADYSIQLVNISEALQYSLDLFIERSKSVTKMIDLLSDPLCRCVCTSYFVNCMSCDAVAKKLDRSKGNVCMLLRQSCKEISESIPIHMIPEEYLNH